MFATCDACTGQGSVLYMLLLDDPPGPPARNEGQGEGEARRGGVFAVGVWSSCGVL